MSQSGSPASNLVYDLVSVQYHALKGAQVYDQYVADAQGNDQVRQFFEQVKQEDAQRAQRCHELLAQVTKEAGIGAGA
jgi:pyrroloquinoline quinone (PQQ) biosynthesis protein C